MLTAPAGAGKTHTRGAATAAGTGSCFRVIGLAPSARAAAELAAATGGHTDTLAKWLHTQARLAQGEPLRPDELAWARLDERTVLLVDEASMASTLDLDRLTALAAANAAKVVLVGDPGQIGVINEAGGMLAPSPTPATASSSPRSTASRRTGNAPPRCTCGPGTAGCWPPTAMPAGCTPARR